MRLLLARHGNTFGPGDKVVMAGSSNDLPLVQRGGEQAEALGKYLLAQNLVPTVVCAGPLRRQHRTAEIIMECSGIPGEPLKDDRLNEVNYGPWTGLSDDEVIEKFGKNAIENWQKQSQFPENWPEQESDVRQRVSDFANDLLKNWIEDENTVLAVSSNGVLRYFLTLAKGAFEKAVEDGTFKVKTGHLCQMSYTNGAWSVDFWNKNPENI